MGFTDVKEIPYALQHLTFLYNKACLWHSITCAAFFNPFYKNLIVFLAIHKSHQSLQGFTEADQSGSKGSPSTDNLNTVKTKETLRTFLLEYYNNLCEKLPNDLLQKLVDENDKPREQKLCKILFKHAVDYAAPELETVVA